MKEDSLGGLELEEQTEEKKEENIADFNKEKPKRRPFHYWTVGGNEYKLKLNTSMIGKLEDKYRTNLMNLVTADGLPPLKVMLTVVQGAMAPWHHKTSYADVERLYDKWTNEGGNQVAFYTKVIMPTMAVSGFFTEAQTESIMKDLEGMDDLM